MRFVITIGWNSMTRPTVKIIYAPNIRSSFCYSLYLSSYSKSQEAETNILSKPRHFYVFDLISTVLWPRQLGFFLGFLVLLFSWGLFHVICLWLISLPPSHSSTLFNSLLRSKYFLNFIMMIIIILLLPSFSHQLMLSNSKSPQVSWTLFCILADINNAVIWIVLILPLYYYFIPWEFFTPANADGLSLKFEWQQGSSSLQDFSQCSGRSQ